MLPFEVKSSSIWWVLVVITVISAHIYKYHTCKYVVLLVKRYLVHPISNYRLAISKCNRLSKLCSQTILNNYYIRYFGQVYYRMYSDWKGEGGGLVMNLTHMLNAQVEIMNQRNRWYIIYSLLFRYGFV